MLSSDESESSCELLSLLRDCSSFKLPSIKYIFKFLYISKSLKISNYLNINY